MKFYSEQTKKFYDTESECQDAEEKYLAEKTNKAAARKADAEKVEKAFNELKAARENYNAALSDFCKKYGAYHKTLTEKDRLDPIDWLFNMWF